MLERGGKGCMVILKGRHADTRQMDSWLWRLLEECPIVSSFSACHALSSFYFLVSGFVSSQFKKGRSLPNRRHCSAKDKVLISRSNADGKHFFLKKMHFPLRRPVPDVLST